MECAEEPILLEYLRGRLAEQAAAEFRQHAEGCPTCRPRLIQARDEVPTGEVRIPDRGGSRTPRPAARPLSRAGDRREAKVEQLPRGTALGRYVVLDQIGEGGVGLVYAAFDPELDRKVAVKLLQVPAEGGASKQDQLLREAQVMARLSHPNILSVYDVGTFGGRVFVALEFVDGTDLRGWLKQQRRPWRQVMEVIMAAGRGLAAAHEAGLVHRDFKPDNILVSKDGRVRVTDFGLARLTRYHEHSNAYLRRVTVVPTEPPGDGEISPPASQPGIVMGTPEYMAPEQFLEGRADDRTDQFSFCITLYEALYGELPFDSAAREGPLNAWKIWDPPKQAKVPLWLRRVLLRGLSPASEERYPSMNELLAALAKDPSIHRRRLLAVGAGIALGLVILGGSELLLSQQSQLCKGAQHKLDGVWDEPRRQAIEAAFLATGEQGALDAWKGAQRELEQYAHGWVEMHTDACMATRLRGEQSEEVMALRMGCLDGRLKELSALGELFTRADGKLVERAVEAANSLSSLQGCADVEALRAPVKPPEGPARAKVEELRGRLAQVKALLDAGRYTQGLDDAKALANAARELGYLPLEAEALDLLGWMYVKAGDAKTAEGLLDQADWDAEAGKVDAVAAEASTRLVYVHYLLGRFEQGHRWARHAEAALKRIGGDERLEGELLNFVGGIFRSEGKFADALARYERALALRERTLGLQHPDVARTLFNLHLVYREKGQAEKALPLVERAAAIMEQTLGAAHLETISMLAAKGALWTEMGMQDRALPLLEQTLSTRLERLRSDHPFVGLNHMDLGDALRKQGDTAAALAHFEKAVAIVSNGYGATHPRLAAVLRQEGLALRDEGHFEEALRLERRAAQMVEEALGPSSFELVDPLRHAADILRDQNKPREALPLYERAMAIGEKTFGTTSQRLSPVLTGLAEAQLALGDHEQAVTLLQRAMALREGHAVDPADDGETRFALARALRKSHTDPEPALRLAEEARVALGRAGKAKAKLLAEVERFLALQAGK